MPEYSVYGLRLLSDRPLSHLQPLPEAGGPEPTLALNFVQTAGLPPFAEPPVWTLVREQTGPGWRMALATASPGAPAWLRLLTSQHGRTAVSTFGPHADWIEIAWDWTPADPADFWNELSGWIGGTLMGYAMSLRGHLTLHGSVVAVDGQAVGLLGTSGAGKSTLAAAFVAAGHTMLADDHLVLGTGDLAAHALPGAPRLRLWPTSLPVMPANGSAHTPWADGDGKYFVPTDGRGHSARPLPLAAVYLLLPPDPTCAAPVCEPLSPAAAITALMQERFCTVPVTPDYPRTTLAGFAALTRTVPVRLLRRPYGLENLPATVAAIREDACRVHA